MINFYNEWLKADKKDQFYYIDAFLRNDLVSKYPFYNYDHKELSKVIKNLLKIDKDSIIENITDSNIEIMPFMITQFSNFEDGVYEVPKMLSFENVLTFKQIGKKIIEKGESGAFLKYGENHAKLAETFSLVNISNGNVCISKLGSEFISLDKDVQNKLLGILALSDRLTQKIIAYSKNGLCFYDHIIGDTISKSTALRRKANVKKIVTIALSDSRYENLLNNIRW